MAIPATYGKKHLQQLHSLKRCLSDPAKTADLLCKISAIDFSAAAQWKTYYRELLFLLAYPADENIHAIAWNEFLRIDDFLLKHKSIAKQLANTGLPNTTVTACFSYHLNRLLLQQNDDILSFYSLDGDKDQAMHLLGQALSGIEKEMLSEEYLPWKKWISLFAGNSRREQIIFILQQIERTGGSIAAREAAFACLKLFTQVKLANNITAFKKATGRFTKPYYHANGPDRAPGEEIFNVAANDITKVSISGGDKKLLEQLAQSTIYPLCKETDPFTFASTAETEYFLCGRGISIALFYMLPEKKLELECYCGYLLLKNNIPVAYGGGWILAHQCRFGLNILPWFRGGESALTANRLMQLFVHRFRVSSFVIDPFQIGKNNREGIQSAAFWFYYKMGFRPMQPSLQQLAAGEYKKLKNQEGYRSSSAVLKKLSESVLCIQSRSNAALPVFDINAISFAVTAHIKGNYQHDRDIAVKVLGKKFAALANRLPLSVMLLLDMAKKDTRLNSRQITALATAFTIKVKSESKFTAALQKQKRFLQLLLQCQAPFRKIS